MRNWPGPAHVHGDLAVLAELRPHAMAEMWDGNEPNRKQTGLRIRGARRLTTKLS